MAGEVVERQKKGGKKGVRRPKRRISIRIDMTPMVDIAFLLLIFYMVSTVFAMPQAMEINLPPKEEKNVDIKIKESNLLTIRIDDKDQFWWNLKIPSPENLPQLLPGDPDAPDSLGYQLWSDTLQGLLTNLNRENSSLSTLILINRDADYAQMVNILDEIDLIERSWNKYTADQLGIKVEDLTKKQGKFSYRYAIGDWETKDDRIIAAAVQAAQAKGEL